SKGISASALPYKRTPPSWLKISSQDVRAQIVIYCLSVLTPSQIGVILRDSHGIAQVRSVTGSNILRILKASGEFYLFHCDCLFLLLGGGFACKMAVAIRKDKDPKFRLILVEIGIHRLARYYNNTKKLPPVWK
ncbi:40S ribosomal protein S13, partial [Linum grandiflorum]